LALAPNIHRFFNAPEQPRPANAFDDRIEEMVEFDLELLDKRSYGLGRSYDYAPTTRTQPQQK